MIITGLARLGRDAELRYTQSGEAVASLALAFNYGKKQDGQQPSQWIEAALWGKRAESLVQYLTKGKQVCIVAEEPHIETYQGKNGPGHKLTARIVSIDFAGSKGDAEQSTPPPQQSDRPSQHQQAKANGYSPAPSIQDMGDDIPF